MPQYLKFTQFPAGLNYMGLIDGRRLTLEKVSWSDSPPYPRPGSRYQLIAHLQNDAGLPETVVRLSHEYDTDDEIKAGLQNGWIVLNDNTQEGAIRKKVIAAMVRDKIIEEVPQPAPPDQ